MYAEVTHYSVLFLTNFFKCGLCVMFCSSVILNGRHASKLIENLFEFYQHSFYNFLSKLFSLNLELNN